MERIKKWPNRASIPVAFIICVLFCLLAANSLTKATVRLAQRHMNEIEGEYVSILPLDMNEVLAGEFTDNSGVEIGRAHV